MYAQNTLTKTYKFYHLFSHKLASTKKQSGTHPNSCIIISATRKPGPNFIGISKLPFMWITLFFLYFGIFSGLFHSIASLPVTVLEQNTYNQCPVCGYPLTTQSAVCPRCGNDILEDISSLDEQSRDVHNYNLDGKKAEWYTRCLTEKLNVCTDDAASASKKSVHQEMQNKSVENSSEVDSLRRISRPELLNEGAARKKWWNALSVDWKEVVKTTLKIVREPSDLELLNFLETTHLRCDSRRIHNLLPVSVLENLQQLRCDESPVESLEPLRNLQHLRRLYAFDCDFSTLEPLRNLKKLKLLWISSTKVTSLEPISNLLALEELYCSETVISDLAPLKALVNLEKLSCYKTAITSLKPLSHLENLIELGIDHSNISDITPLAELNNLEYLRCNKTGITSVEALRNLFELRELSLANTPLVDIEPLEGLANLEELDLSNTSITSIAPIMQLQNLEKIELSAGRIPHTELERFIELHPSCEVLLKP